GLAVPALATGMVDLGSFQLDDPRAAVGGGAVFSKKIQSSTPPAKNPEQQNQAAYSFFLDASNISLHFPIFENPTNLFPLLLGEDVQFFTLTVPSLRLHLAASFP